MKCLYSLTTTTSAGLWTQRVWAPNKSTRPRSSLITNSRLISNKVRQKKLPIPCFVTVSGVLRWKRLFEPRTSKSYTVYSLYWPEYLAFWFDSSQFFSFHQIFICETTVLLRLNKFWDTLQAKLNEKKLYKTSIRAMRLRLQELQETDLGS